MKLLMPVMLQEYETPLHINISKCGCSVLPKSVRFVLSPLSFKKRPGAQHQPLCPAAQDEGFGMPPWVSLLLSAV